MTFPRTHRTRRGQSLVEFVLVLPLLLLLVLGIFEATRATAIYTVMSDLAGDTARLWAKPAYQAYTQTQIQSIIFDSLQENNIDTSNMAVFVETGADPDEGDLNYRQVAIQYTVQPLGGGGSIKFGSYEVIKPNLKLTAVGHYVEESAFY